MSNNQTIRRIFAVLLILLGAAMIFLATNAWTGALLVVLGILIEAIGIAMKQK